MPSFAVYCTFNSLRADVYRDREPVFCSVQCSLSQRGETHCVFSAGEFSVANSQFYHQSHNSVFLQVPAPGVKWVGENLSFFLKNKAKCKFQALMIAAKSLRMWTLKAQTRRQIKKWLFNLFKVNQFLWAWLMILSSWRFSVLSAHFAVHCCDSVCSADHFLQRSQNEEGLYKGADHSLRKLSA